PRRKRLLRGAPQGGVHQGVKRCSGSNSATRRSTAFSLWSSTATGFCCGSAAPGNPGCRSGPTTWRRSGTGKTSCSRSGREIRMKQMADIEKVVAGVKWRDIKSAPKDGTRVLLAKIVGDPRDQRSLLWAVAGYWVEGDEVW